MKVIKTPGFEKLSHWDDNTQRGYEFNPGRGGGGMELLQPSTDNPSTEENEINFSPKKKRLRIRKRRERNDQIADRMPKGML